MINIYKTLASQQVSINTTVENLLGLTVYSDFDSALKAIRKAYKQKYELKNDSEEYLIGDRAFTSVLNKAKELQKQAEEMFGQNLKADVAVRKAIENLSKEKKDKKGNATKPKLLGYTYDMWLNNFANRATALLFNTRFAHECSDAKIVPLFVAAKLVWMGNKQIPKENGKVINIQHSQYVLEHGIVGYNFDDLNDRNLFPDYKVIAEYITNCDSAKGISSIADMFGKYEDPE